MALGAQLKDVVDSLSELVAQHIALAKLEFAEDAGYFGARIGVIAALAPLIFVGYLFLCAALAIALASLMSLGLALVIVGLLNLALGVGGIVIAVKQLQARKPMASTVSELEASSLVLRQQGAPRP